VTINKESKRSPRANLCKFWLETIRPNSPQRFKDRQHTSDLQMLKGIIYDFSKQPLSPVKPKTGKYLLSKAL